MKNFKICKENSYQVFRITEDPGNIHGTGKGNKDLLALAIGSEPCQAFTRLLKPEKKLLSLKSERFCLIFNN
jgi:hypothetical protein